MKTLALPITLLALGILVLAGVLLLKPMNTAFGGAFTGTSAYLQTSTTTVVGPQGAAAVKTQIFAENTACKARVVTTSGLSAVMISFDDIPAAGNVGSTTVSGTVGHWQAASTTVAYDSGIYGCGTWNAYGYASSTITVSEF